MLASPEAAKFVLVTHAHLFKPTYPKSKEMLIGPSALFFHQGDYHTKIRRLVQTSLSPERIRKLVPYIEAEAVSTLESWVSAGQVVNVFQSMKKVSSDILLNDVMDTFLYLASILLSHTVIAYNCTPKDAGMSQTLYILLLKKFQISWV